MKYKYCTFCGERTFYTSDLISHLDECAVFLAILAKLAAIKEPQYNIILRPDAGC